MIEKYKGTPAESIQGKKLYPFDENVDHEIYPQIEFQTGLPATVNAVRTSGMCEVVSVRAGSSGETICTGFYMVTSIQLPPDRHLTGFRYRLAGVFKFAECSPYLGP